MPQHASLRGIEARLVTEYPLACESPDHIHPWGTARDNSRNPEFNRKLHELYRKPIKVMDIGCSGGGFVKDMLDEGNFAIGLEGSDYSRRNARAEWATIPGNLFTCDCAKPYDVHEYRDGRDTGRMRFELITAWEVLEHIDEKSLPRFLENVKKHLSPDNGIFIASISPKGDCPEGVELHQTIQPREWWKAMFRANGFVLSLLAIRYFRNDWIRGPHQYAPDSFHVVASLGRLTAMELRMGKDLAAQKVVRAKKKFLS